MTEVSRSVLIISGPPAIGKTSLIKSVVNTIKQKLCHRFVVKGFYTEEVRSTIGYRIGFDVIDINEPSHRRPLARVDRKTGPIVGKYRVDVESFEEIAVPLITVTDSEIRAIEASNRQLIVVIDEIGKMEAFSDIFRKGVKQLFDSNVPSNSYKILTSLPAKRNVAMAEEVRQRPGNREIRLNRRNRDAMADRVVGMLCETAIR